MEDANTKLILNAIGTLSSKIGDFGDALQGLAQHMDERFDEVYTRFEQIDRRFEQMDARLDKMVTKTHLDERLADFKGDLVSYIGREDAKILAKIAA